MSVLIGPQCCEHCLNRLHCNNLRKTRCSIFLGYISHLHKSNAHQELISVLKDLICPVSTYSCERRVSQ